MPGRGGSPVVPQQVVERLLLRRLRLPFEIRRAPAAGGAAGPVQRGLALLADLRVVQLALGLVGRGQAAARLLARELVVDRVALTVEQPDAAAQRLAQRDQLRIDLAAR